MNKVNKTDLVRSVYLKTGIRPRFISQIVDAFLSSIVECTNNGSVVNIYGFGKFQKKHRAARTGRNPSTGEAIPIAECDKLMFTASK